MDIQVGLRRTPSAWSIAWAILLMVSGLAAVALPAAVSMSVTIILAWVLMFVGFIHLVSSWTAPTVSAVVWKILLGLLYVVAGITMHEHPVWGLASLTIVIGAVCLAEGVVGLMAFVVDGDRSVASLLTATLSFVLGLMIWNQWPFSSLWLVGTLVGINLFFAGVTDLLFAIAERRFDRVGRLV